MQTESAERLAMKAPWMQLETDHGPDPLDVCADEIRTVQGAKSSTEDDKTSTKTDTFTPAATALPSAPVIPLCPGHQLPCRLRTVKKASSRHRGRKFYACSLSREQQCDAFFWFDAVDRSEVREHLSDESVPTSVRAERLQWFLRRAKNMTCFELRRELKRMGLRANGKKAELMARLHVAHSELLEWLDENLDAARSGTDPGAVEGVLRRVFGHDDWLPGQEESICRVLRGESLLLVLPTGGGKSLCYQLPALVLGGLTIVISPLLSLMMDQLQKLPAGLCGASIGSNQSPTETAEVIAAVRRGVIQILFVSPERLMSPRFQRLMAYLRTKWKKDIVTASVEGDGDVAARATTSSSSSSSSSTSAALAPSRWRQQEHVSLIVVDEAHCVSQWSHNFRPAYLRLQSVLPALCGPNTPVLALTATVTKSAASRVQRILRLPRENIYHRSWRRRNLHIRVCRTRDKIDALTRVLKRRILPGVFSEERCAEDADDADEGGLARWSCIVYVLHRAGCEITAKVLRERGINCAAYHGKLPSEERRRVQERFCGGSLRVVVATTAFGMGLDKSNVRAVVHLNMPRSVESYVQEMGRAGRDGEDALCLLLLDDDDARRLMALTAADGIDRAHIRALLASVFPSDDDANAVSMQDGGNASRSPLRREWWLPIDEAQSQMDVSQATVETLIVLMNSVGRGETENDETPEEKKDSNIVQLCPPSYTMIRVKFYGQQHRVKRTNAVVRSLCEALSDAALRAPTSSSFDDLSGRPPPQLLDLRKIAFSSNLSFDKTLAELRKLKRTGVLSYELCRRAMRAVVLREPPRKDVERLEARLWELTRVQREGQRVKVASLFLSLLGVATSSTDDLLGEKKSLAEWGALEETLSADIDAYFERVRDDTGVVNVAVTATKGEKETTDSCSPSTEQGPEEETSTVSAYEKQRLATIAKNEATLRALGLLKPASTPVVPPPPPVDPFAKRMAEIGSVASSEFEDDLMGVVDVDKDDDVRVIGKSRKVPATSRRYVATEAAATTKGEENDMQSVSSIVRADTTLFMNTEKHEAHINAEIRSILFELREKSGNGDAHIDDALRLSACRVLARIAHAIPSPAFPRESWKTSARWGRLKMFSFSDVRKIAAGVLSTSA
eukprot:g5158.t1